MASGHSELALPPNSPDQRSHVGQTGREAHINTTLNQQQSGGVRFNAEAHIVGLVTGGDVTNSGVINIYSIQVSAAQAHAVSQATQDLDADPPCPYPGLRPFRPEDSRFFYGRETEIAHLMLRLQREHL